MPFNESLVVLAEVAQEVWWLRPKTGRSVRLWKNKPDENPCKSMRKKERKNLNKGDQAPISKTIHKSYIRESNMFPSGQFEKPIYVVMDHGD